MITTKKNTVFIATSLDGFIAGKNGELDWLHAIPNPDGEDMGFTALLDEVDAVVMGRTTFETVLGFGVDWPYSKPVIVLSRTMKSVPEELTESVKILWGSPTDILYEIHSTGYHHLYIDGGSTVQGFLKEDLVDELIISTIPILLGGGFSLFGDLEKPMEFEHLSTEVFLGQVVQSRYLRKRK